MDLFKKKDPRIVEINKKIIKAIERANSIAEELNPNSMTFNSEEDIHQVGLFNDYVKEVKNYKDLVQQKQHILNQINPNDEKGIEKTLKQLASAEKILHAARTESSNNLKMFANLNNTKLPAFEETFGGRKRKTRKHIRSRKVKKTRKH